MTQKFLDQILEDVFDRAHAPETASIRLTALTTVLLEYLEEAGVYDSPQVAHYRLEKGNIAAEVHGYTCDLDDDVISLFFCIDSTAEIALGQPMMVRSTGKDALDRAFRRLEAFAKLAVSDRITEPDESQPSRDLVDLLRGAEKAGQTIEFHVLTTGTVSDRAATTDAKGGHRRELWDL